MSHQDPIIIFLKLTPDAPPGTLLGLGPDRLSDDDVLLARSERLAQIDAHPLSATPDADEARLAIHAAAAQLLQQSAASRASSHTSPSQHPPLPRPRPRFGVSRAAATLERDTLILVGLSGGWSPKVLTRLAAIAITRGLTARDAVDAAHRLARRPSRPSPPPATTSTRGVPARTAASRAAASQPGDSTIAPPLIEPGQSDEAVLENWIKTTLVVGGSIGITIGIVILGSIWAFSTLNASTPTSETAKRISTSTDPGQPSRVSPPRDEIDNAELVLHELNAAQTLLQTNHALQAVDRIQAATDHWLARWPTHPPYRWRAILQRLTPLIETIRLDPMGDQKLVTLFSAALPPIGEPVSAEAVPRVIATAAVLGSLDHSKPTALTRVWLAYAPIPLPEGATPAATFAMHDLARSRIENSPEAYAAWADSVSALSAIGSQDPGPALILGASELLGRLNPPSDPEQQAIAELVSRLDWRSGSDARSWLIDRMNDRTVHPQRVSVALNTLATNSSAPGIKTSHRLGPGASWAQRRAMSQALADVWDLRLSISTDLYLEEWLARADQLLAAPPSQTLLEKLDLLGDLAYLNTSALLSLAGHEDEAVSNLSRTKAPVPLFEPLSPLFTAAPSSRLVHVVPGSNTDELLDALSTVKGSDDPISHADASTLVDLAFTNRNEVVRTAAQDALRQIAASPTVLLAAMEASPLIADSEPNRALLSAIASDTVTPSPGEDWHDAVHRVLAGSLLARTTSPAATIDSAVRRVHSAYTAATRLSPTDRAAPLEQHARTLTSHQLSTVHPSLGYRPVTTPAQIASLRDTRLQVASGPIQRFAIEQFALVSATAINASSNRHELEGPIQSLWTGLQTERTAATSALDQALLSERTHTRILSLVLALRNAPTPPASWARSLAAPSGLAPGRQSAPPQPTLSGANPREDLNDRLERLSPDRPAGYLELAEELQSIGRDNLAVHAFVIAMAQASHRADLKTAASACLALVDHTSDPADKQLLRALADTLNPRLSRPAWLEPDRLGAGSTATSLKAARLFLDLRRGRGDRALEALRDPDVRRVLEQQPELASIASGRGTTSLEWLAQHARAWPCPDCNNTGTVKPRGQADREPCPSCHGKPGVILQDREQIAWLTVEIRLLSPDTPWSSALAFPGQSDPVAEPGLDSVPRLFGVDASKTLYRNGQWTRP